MSVDKSKTPSVAFLMPLGCRGTPTKDDIAAARKTQDSFSLPDIDWKNKPAEFNNWREKAHLSFVREEQAPFFQCLENDVWKMVVYPNEIATHISNIREYIRCFPVDADVVINVDSDFEWATDAPHAPWKSCAKSTCIRSAR